MNVGLGFDLSNDYHNVMIGLGLDIVRTLRTFSIIPKDPTPPLNGFFPSASTLSADGLPDAMTHGEEKATSPPNLVDVSKIVKNIPKNMLDKVEGFPTSVEKSEKKALSKKHRHPKKKTIPSPTPSISK